MSERNSGILAHITSLPSDFGIGDLGPGTYRFVDFLCASQQSFWQILPINPTDAITEHSPYSSSSAFAGNVLLISPELLVADGILTKKDIVPKSKFSAHAVDYQAVVTYKHKLYDLAYERFVSDSSVRRAHENSFEQFITKNAHWLDDYALFVTIKAEQNQTAWHQWPGPFQRRNPKALKDFQANNHTAIRKVQFFQYIFFKQWETLKTYCTKNNIHLIGDMAIYMNYDSCDVWAHPENYKLDDRLRPVVVSGVPPDYFSSTGQHWGNPVYDWGYSQENQFDWWVSRFRWNLKLFDTVRIDHFRGLVQYWEIPESEQTAVNGAWMDVPTDAFFSTLEQTFSKPLPIIAEDLGYITDDVRDVMRRYDFPGMKVLLFAFDGDLNDHPYLPHNYDTNCVVYTGTHDNNTILGWFQNEASTHAKNNLEQYLNKKVTAKSVCLDMIHLALHSEAWLAMIPLPDLLGLGEEARLNKPATMHGNWQWRAIAKMFDPDLTQRLLQMTKNAQRDQFGVTAKFQ